MATDEMLESVSKRAEEVYQGLKESSHHCASIAKASWRELRSNGQLQKLQQPVSIAIILLFLAASTAAYIIRRQNLKQLMARRPSTPTTPRLEKALKTPQREWGKWVASDFRTPKPAPYPNWSIEHTKPLPYRPFRYGPKYHVTMGLRSLNLDDWIELDNQFPRYHADKTQRIAEKGSKLCGTAPEAYPAAVELLEELTEYLPARYPSLFKRTEVGLDNLWSGESFDIVSRPLAEDPMQTCARLVQDDLAIMIERADGQYYLLAGCIVLPGFWRMQDKFGMPLSEIHTSGSVPQYKERLEKGMMNLFRRLKPEEIVSRHNYFMQVDDGLPWSTSIGDEDDPDRERTWDTAEKDRAVEHHYYRSERQSLRRLPRTGGIVFTIRTYFHPIKEIAEEDYVPGRLASAVRSWGADVSKYKGKEKYGDVLLEFLDKKHEEQVARGLDLSREDEVRAYPF